MARQKADSTLRCSQAVPHPSTNRALSLLTSEVGRDPVHSTRYGRQRIPYHCQLMCSSLVMLCYVMLCYVMLCYVMLSYVMLCYVMLRYVTLCYVMLCYVVLCSVMLCYRLCYVMVLYAMLCQSSANKKDNKELCCTSSHLHPDWCHFQISLSLHCTLFSTWHVLRTASAHM
jgi:hypothetical protein